MAEASARATNHLSHSPTALVPSFGQSRKWRLRKGLPCFTLYPARTKKILAPPGSKLILLEKPIKGGGRERELPLA